MSSPASDSGHLPEQGAEPVARPYPLTLVALWVAFALVHVVLILGVAKQSQAFLGDVNLYHFWAAEGLNNGNWPVIDSNWVYPAGALVPVTIPAILFRDEATYQAAYMLLVTLMNGLALGSLVHLNRNRLLGAWWYLGFLLALGPILLTRLDGVSAALTLIALCQAAPTATRQARIGLASTLAAFGAWIKIAPGAALIAMFLTQRRPIRRVAVPALAVTVVVVGAAWIGGAGGRILGFLGDQRTRGLQIESAGATPFSVARVWDTAYTSGYNEDLSTWEISGPHVNGVARGLDFLLVIAVAAVAVATWRAVRRLARLALGVADEPYRLELTLFVTALLSLVLFVCNKVGSPQFVAWFAPPVAVALSAFSPRRLAGTRLRSWPALVVGILIVAGLTQYLYPWGYWNFLFASQWSHVMIGALRNAIIVVLAVWLGFDLLMWRPRVSRAVRPEAAVAATVARG